MAGLDEKLIKCYVKGDIWKIIECKDEIDSTNAYLKRKEDLTGGEVVFAKRQTHGRGRLGRNWCSPEGNLYMSLAVKVKAPCEAPIQGLKAAVAVAEALLKIGVEAKIKWPNDITVQGKKLCGILSEMARGNIVIVGIGVNIAVSKFDEELINPAIALAEVIKDFDENRLAADILNIFGQDDENIIKRYKKYCVNLGRTVKIIENGGEYVAEAVDVNEFGNLIINRDGKLWAVNSGEVSVRGIYGYTD